MAEQAAGQDYSSDGAARYRADERYVEFECGCTAERFATLIGARPSDPVIFRGLEFQALYLQVCHPHTAKMNDYVRLGGYPTFADWLRDRRRDLISR
jgi:hypothetical protein